MQSIQYKILGVAAAAVALAASFALADDNEKEEKPEVQGTVSWRKGSVERRPAGKEKWNALDKGDSVFMGVVVGFIAISVMGPIFKLVSSIS